MVQGFQYHQETRDHPSHLADLDFQQVLVNLVAQEIQLHQEHLSLLLLLVFQHHQVNQHLLLAQLVLEDLKGLKILNYLLVPEVLEGPEILGLQGILHHL